MASKKKLRKKIKRMEDQIAVLEHRSQYWQSEFFDLMESADIHSYMGKGGVLHYAKAPHVGDTITLTYPKSFDWYANDTGGYAEPDHVTASAPTWWEEPYWPE